MILRWHPVQLGAVGEAVGKEDKTNKKSSFAWYWIQKLHNILSAIVRTTPPGI